MGIRMALRVMPSHILTIIDIKNAFNAIWRAAVIERHQSYKTLRRTVPYWRVKLGPRSPIWAEVNTLWGVDGLRQGSPSSGFAFALTIRPWVREAVRRVAANGGCTKFGIDDGYMVGPKEVIFQYLAEFVKGIREST